MVPAQSVLVNGHRLCIIPPSARNKGFQIDGRNLRLFAPLYAAKSHRNNLS